jgi:ComF family protein
MTSFLTQTFYENWDSTSFDLVVPVPLHIRRRRNRGYNQSDLIARGLARKIGISYNSRLLIRTRNSASQVGLSDKQRQENVRNAFRCTDPGQISGRRILLIDDVMTTGATVRSASRALVAAGALRVSVLVMARTEL